MIRVALFLTAGITLAGSGPARPVAIAPAATATQLGTVEIVALRDALNVVPNDGSVFGTNVNPAAVADVLGDAGAPRDSVTLGVDALLVKESGRIVLIDSGLGPKAHGMLPASLAAAKVAPAAITDVLLTHGHPDHLGGLLTAAGAPAFPNATIHLAAAEWAWLRGDPRNAALVAALADRARTFATDGDVVPGIRAIASPGHTPGHTLYEIRSGKQRLIDIGDSAHSSIVSLARPDWTIAYDGDGPAATERRRALLARLAKSGERVFAPHFPFPGFGRIMENGRGGYRWVADPR